MNKIDEIEDCLIELQAEISALKQLMFNADPKLAAAHEALRDRILAGFRVALQENRRNRP